MTSPTAQTSNPPLNSTLAVLAAAAVQELDPVWTLKPTEIGGALMDLLPPLVDKWGLASASAAADWYDNLREDNDIRGRFTAIVPPLDNLGAEPLAAWAAQPLDNPVGAEHSHDEPSPQPKRSGLTISDASDAQPSGFHILDEEPVDLDTAPDEAVDLDVARQRAEGGLQKRLVNAANLTVTGSVVEDPNARGWMRQTRPNACKFCVMVASRGGVFTKASATFACHEHCYCQAIPAWGGKALPVGPYKPSDNPSTAADRARVRKWIADNL